MRVVVVGASGNVGTSLLRELADEPTVDSVVGLCRRVPEIRFPKVEWRAADVATTQLAPHFRGADAVVHLAWLIQPGRDRNLTRRVNVLGSERVFRAVSDASVGTLVYASSVGAYGQGPKDRQVDESWPTTGTQSSFYARDKATVERLLDRFEREQPGIRAVRLRPGSSSRARPPPRFAGCSRARSCRAASCTRGWSRSCPRWSGSSSRPSIRVTSPAPTGSRSPATLSARSTSQRTRSSTAPGSPSSSPLAR